MFSATSIYGLIGYPLGHSFSQRYFAEKFEREGIDAQYLNFELNDISQISDVIAIPELRGFNVTIPYKQKIIPLLDSISPMARKAGAVNVVKVVDMPDGTRRLYGFNSDCGGFLSDIVPMLTPDHTKALILGHGGAAQAVRVALDSINIHSTYVTRRQLPDSILFSELTHGLVNDHKVIIQCTPLGMYPNIDSCPPIPYEAIGSRHLCYDVVYNPAPTEFLKRCAVRGAAVRDGAGMLIAQAELAWNIWNDTRITTKV
ncbi:MAG: shikimate dehydrogenase [Paramuribaculum sp.]|nr:shikimate dehydrogenase [Paramuribaculum sp.]